MATTTKPRPTKRAATKKVAARKTVAKKATTKKVTAPTTRKVAAPKAKAHPLAPKHLGDPADVEHVRELLQRAADLMKDGAYTTVGLGVLGVQQLQVRRREFEARLRPQVEEMGDTFETRVHHLEDRLDELETRIDHLLDQVAERLPESARDALDQARQAAKDARGQLFSLVKRAA